MSTRDAIRGAFGHPSYLLLTAGFFVCGFHIAFVTTHLPPYLGDLGFSASLAAWSVALIGLFNVIGAYTAGVLGGRMSKRLLLSGIYFSRAIAFLLFVRCRRRRSACCCSAPRSACCGSRPCR